MLRPEFEWKPVSNIDAERVITNSFRVATLPSAPFPLAPSPIAGRHYRTGMPIAIQHANGRLTAIEAYTDDSPHLPWVAPPLVDLQVNGFAGIDYQRDDVSLSELEHSGLGLLAAGCGRFLLTLITDEWSRMLERLRLLRALRDRSSLLKAMIAGWHVEGPFLSSDPGFHGAHPPEFMLDPAPQHVGALQNVVGRDPLLLTLAPERSGAVAAIRAAVAAGFRVSLGHTNANSRQLAEAIAAGANGFTHLGNACPQLLDRHDNILWRVLDRLRKEREVRSSEFGVRDSGAPLSGAALPGQSHFCASLIPDGLHIPAALFRVLHGAADPSKVFYVSDAMAGAGAPPGPATLGSLHLEVGADGVVRQPGQTNFAGSALRPIDGVFRAAHMLDTTWADCWDRFSIMPAQWMRWPANPLEISGPADFCLFDLPEEDSHLDTGQFTGLGRVRRVVLAGQQVYCSSGDGGDREVP